MDAPPPETTAKRRKLRILLAAILVLIFFGSLGYVLISRPQLPVTVILIVLAGVAAAVFAAYFIPNKLSERAKRAVSVGVAAVGVITTLLAPVINGGGDIGQTQQSPSPSPSPSESRLEDPLTATLNLNNSAGCEDFIVEASLLSSLPAGDDLNAEWVYEHGGATYSIVAPISLTVQGKGEEAVVLHGLRVTELERLPEPANLVTLLPCGATGGALGARFFKVDFSNPPKVTAEPGYDPSTGEVLEAPVKFPYTVTARDPEVFYLELEEHACFCTWRLALDWASGERSGTTVIDRGFGKIRTDSNRDEEGKLPTYERDPHTGTWDPPLPK